VITYNFGMSLNFAERAGWLLAGLFLFFSHAALAQQVPALKIGYTDHEIIISNMPEYRQIQEQLQGELERTQAEIQELVGALEEKAQRYERQQGLLSEQRLQERQQELMNDQTEIQERVQSAESDLAVMEADLLSPIFQRVDEAIKKISEEKGLDLVLRIQAGQGQPIILYANEQRITDITLDVARELGIDVGDPAPGN